MYLSAQLVPSVTRQVSMHLVRDRLCVGVSLLPLFLQDSGRKYHNLTKLSPVIGHFFRLASRVPLR